jgi:hypothetical protein
MGSSGSGSVSHVFGERFKMMTRINLVHVPYKANRAIDDQVARSNADDAEEIGPSGCKPGLGLADGHEAPFAARALPNTS